MLIIDVYSEIHFCQGMEETNPGDIAPSNRHHRGKNAESKHKRSKSLFWGSLLIVEDQLSFGKKV